MKIYGRILWLVAVLSVMGVTTAFALRPSGPGINTKANSLSVAIATDQPAVAVTSASTAPVVANETPGNVAVVVKAEIDAGAGGIQNCKSGLWVEAAGDGGLVFVPYGAADAATTVTLTAVPAGRLPMAVQRVVTTGTTIGIADCLNP